MNCNCNVEQYQKSYSTRRYQLKQGRATNQPSKQKRQQLDHSWIAAPVNVYNGHGITRTINLVEGFEKYSGQA